MEYNFEAVTVDDILVSLGNSLPQCFGDELTVKQEETEDSVELTLMVAEEVAINVNRGLGNLVQPTSPSSLNRGFKIYHLAKFLRCCMMKEREPNMSPVTPIGSKEELIAVPFSISVEELIPVALDAQEEELIPEPLDVYEVELTLEPLDAQEEELNLEKDDLLKKSTFLNIFLMRLLDHIAHSAKATVGVMDVINMSENLVSIMLENNFSCPTSVRNLHLTVYKKLRRRFGSANELYAVILCENMTFMRAVAEELQKAIQKPSFTAKLRKFFRSRKIHSSTPGCACTICKFFSAAARVLRRPFI